MYELTITIHNSINCGYSVIVNGETILECMGEDEVKDLTIEEIAKLYNETEKI